MARRGRTRLVVATAASIAVVAPLAWLWAGSNVPPEYSVMGMGYPDYGGGPVVGSHAAHGDHAWVGPPRRSGEVSVADLTGPRSGRPDVSVRLVARHGVVRLPTGRPFTGYTLNGTSPGPTIRARQGDLVQVRLVNAGIREGVTLHWHGLDVPNAEDGVAGVTQDAVPAGGSFTYRFVARQAGTYWYHSHQVAHEQVRGGLFGMLVVAPRRAARRPAADVVAPVHGYDGTRTIAGRAGVTRVDAPAGGTVRVRLADTDDRPLRAWVSGAPYRIAAVDGHDVNQPPPVTGRAVLLGAGGRYDLELTVPRDGRAVRVDVGGAALVVGPPGSSARAVPAPARDVDLLSYGSPVPVALDHARPDRRFEYRMGRRPGFLDGRPGLFWTVNGHMFPAVPMFVVGRGDVVRMKISNSSGQAHPMHLHGHHVLVLSRDGVSATGSPWWTDTLEVADGETYEVAFVADNPGIWMDHCHNLPHVAEGLVVHLAYAGVWEPYRVGVGGNSPE
ncbi:MAG TPA: multicopper oxidase family protein [Streptosporangiales bacterium]